MKPTLPELAGPPVVGHIFEFVKDRSSVLQRGFLSLGPVFSVRLANQRAAVLVGPEYLQIFFEQSDKKLSNHKAYKFVKAIFGEVGLAARPEVYEKQRPIMLLPFKSGKMASYIPIIQYEAQKWLDALGESGEVELLSAITRLVQNVAAHALMGEAFHNQAGAEFWDLYLLLENSFDPFLPSYLPLPKFIRRDQAKKKLDALLRPIIAERRVNPDGYHDFLQDFVSARYKDGHPLDDETIIALVLSLVFAGYATTAGQAAWTIAQLLQAPEYLQVVQQEISEQLSSDEPITGKVLNSLSHVFWAVQETTRMHPSADVLMRRAEEDIDIGDYRIPKGWNVIVCSGISHMLPTSFTEPQKYDPLRFAPGREEDRRHRFAMAGFGGGTHKCPGMHFAYNEMMVITSLLFQQFELELVTKNPRHIYSSGLGRPEKIVVRYMRKRNSDAIGSVPCIPATGCPHMMSVLEAPRTTQVSTETN